MQSFGIKKEKRKNGTHLFLMDLIEWFDFEHELGVFIYIKKIFCLFRNISDSKNSLSEKATLEAFDALKNTSKTFV
jgi:hypothetical protein